MQPILPNATIKAIAPITRNHGLPATVSKIPAAKTKAMTR